VQPHVRQSRPRTGRWVELPHVVARLVHAQLRELGSGAHSGSSVLAGQRAGGAPHKCEVERLDDA
jgi:hypothetical protein